VGGPLQEKKIKRDGRVTKKKHGHHRGVTARKTPPRQEWMNQRSSGPRGPRKDAKTRQGVILKKKKTEEGRKKEEEKRSRRYLWRIRGNRFVIREEGGSLFLKC